MDQEQHLQSNRNFESSSGCREAIVAMSKSLKNALINNPAFSEEAINRALNKTDESGPIIFIYNNTQYSFTATFDSMIIKAMSEVMSDKTTTQIYQIDFANEDDEDLENGLPKWATIQYAEKEFEDDPEPRLCLEIEANPPMDPTKAQIFRSSAESVFQKFDQLLLMITPPLTAQT